MVGNKPNYQKEDIIRAFLLMENNPVSRSELVRKLGLGEGTIRTILDILKEKELIDSMNKGHFLSLKGEKKKADIENKIDGPKKLNLEQYKGMKSVGVLVKNSSKIKITLEQRDDAIRSGAYSAMIFRYTNELQIPGAEVNFKKDYPKDYEKIMKRFDLKKGEILIITFAKENRVCENSALAVATTFCKLDP